MDRVSSAGYQTLGVGRSWQNMNLGSGIQGTTFDQVWFQGVQESIVETIAKSGQTPADSTLGSPDTQLLNAILAFAGANTQVVSSTPGSPLTALSAGLVVVNATAGNISITLPASAGFGGNVQRWKFARADGTSNTVSIAFHAGDTLLIGGGSGPLSLGPLAVVDLTADGSTHWVQSSASAFIGIFGDSGTANAMAVTLSPAPASYAAIQGIPFIVKKGAAANVGALTMALNGLAATATVRADGSAFGAGQWPANAEAQVVYDGIHIVALTDPAPAWVPGSSLATNGYRMNLDGSIDQWYFVDFGSNQSEGLYGPYTWPIAFPNAVLNIQVTTLTPEGTGSAGSGDDFMQISMSNKPTATQFWVWNNSNGVGTDAARGFYVRAIGW